MWYWATQWLLCENKMLLFQQQKSTGGCSHNKLYSGRKEYICITSVYSLSRIKNWALSKVNQLSWFTNVLSVTLLQFATLKKRWVGTINAFEKLSILLIEQGLYSKREPKIRQATEKENLRNIFITIIEAWLANHRPATYYQVHFPQNHISHKKL